MEIGPRKEPGAQSASVEVGGTAARNNRCSFAIRPDWAADPLGRWRRPPNSGGTGRARSKYGCCGFVVLSVSREIAPVLATQFPSRVTRASAIQASYECGGELVAFDPSDPTVDLPGHSIRHIVTPLALRYRCSFWRGSVEEGLRRLSLVRYRWLPELKMQVGDRIILGV